MKSKIVFWGLLVLICTCTACSSTQPLQTKTSVPTYTKTEAGSEIIYNDRFFKIIKRADSKYYYIYNMDKIVSENDEITKYPTVEQVNDNILDIHMGMGTGLAWHQYYSMKRDSFSGTYWYVLAFEDEMVAYIYVPEEHPFEGRKIVVRNVFDKSEYFREFNLDFSEVDTPIIKAIFTNDGSQLQVTYLTGENQEETTQFLDLGNS